MQTSISEDDALEEDIGELKQDIGNNQLCDDFLWFEACEISGTEYKQRDMEEVDKRIGDFDDADPKPRFDYVTEYD